LDRYLRAFQMAYEAHKGKCRKGTDIPYIIHPIDVASILMRENASEDLVIAGLLHDVVEDTKVTLEEVKREFGNVVSGLVEGATEPEKRNKKTRLEEKESWRERKEQAISRTRSANRELKLLECADKLANFRDIMRDYSKVGNGLWSRFNAGSEDQRWYYESMVEALGAGPYSLDGTDAYDELKKSVKEFFTSLIEIKK
jgi:(p)ppGpp synthase/HD superfamily hydrolase